MRSNLLLGCLVLALACTGLNAASGQTVVYYQPQPQPGPVYSAGDAYGFGAWLNAQRAAYGLPALAHDPNLDAWAQQNNLHQAGRGLGHYVMGPASRQNAGVGAFAQMGAAWLASPAHRAALLDPKVRWYGIAGYGAWWTFNAR